MNKNKSLYWNLCIAGVILVSILSFTPLVLPVGIYEPMLFGVPYSLWMGILVAILLVFLTYLGTKVHPGNGEEDHND
ncbi:hypothetical protein [Reichenbachiella sp. MALMAid0571]|uniref:hypothetical protein n=1 Tax=Reichenbachiella sp. MALMAid0571 TaxID=3143939 RepID=UPI0032DEAD40